MRAHFVLSSALLAVLALPRANYAQAADTSGVLAAVHGMLDGMRARNAEQIRSSFHEQARLTLLRPAADGGVRVVVMTGADFVNVATNPQGSAIDEPIRNTRVQIDGDLASVWAEYQVRRDGKVSHCGFDAFHLVRVAGRWKILNVSDTYRQQGCGDIWRD